MSGHKHVNPRPARKKRVDQSEFPQSFLPQNNQRARTAYLCVLLGLLPGIALFAAPLAIVFGWLGIRAARKESGGNGLGHSYISVVLGTLELVTNVTGLLLFSHHYGWL